VLEHLVVRHQIEGGVVEGDPAVANLIGERRARARLGASIEDVGADDVEPRGAARVTTSPVPQPKSRIFAVAKRFANSRTKRLSRP